MQAEITVSNRDAIDVCDCRRTANGDYLLVEYIPNVVYVDTRTGEVIHSIAEVTRPLASVMQDGARVMLEPGVYLASTTRRFYAPGVSLPVKCVFWR